MSRTPFLLFKHPPTRITIARAITSCCNLLCCCLRCIHSSGWLSPAPVTLLTKQKNNVYFIVAVADTPTGAKRCQSHFSPHVSSGSYWPLEKTLLRFKLRCSTWKFNWLNKWSTGKYCMLWDANKSGMFEEKYWKNAIGARVFLMLHKMLSPS